MVIEEEYDNENFKDAESVEVDFERELIRSLKELKTSRKKRNNLKYQLLKYEEHIEKVKRIEEYLTRKM